MLTFNYITKVFSRNRTLGVCDDDGNKVTIHYTRKRMWACNRKVSLHHSLGAVLAYKTLCNRDILFEFL